MSAWLVVQVVHQIWSGTRVVVTMAVVHQEAWVHQPTLLVQIWAQLVQQGGQNPVLHFLCRATG